MDIFGLNTPNHSQSANKTKQSPKPPRAFLGRLTEEVRGLIKNRNEYSLPKTRSNNRLQDLQEITIH